MDSLKKSKSAWADRCSTKNKIRNGKCSPATLPPKAGSHGLNFRRFLFPSCSVALFVVAIYMLLLEITPMRSRIMAQIQGRNLAELNEDGCLREGDSNKNLSSSDFESDHVLSGSDKMDLGENEEKDGLEADENVEEKYEEKNDLCNIDSPRFDEAGVKFVTDLTKEQLDELINNMEEVPSKDEIIKMWKRAYALEGQEFYEMMNGLFEYYEELKGKHHVEEEPLFSLWSGVMSRCFHVVAEREQEYSKLFNVFIIKDGMTKQEFVNFLEHCRKEAAEFRESLEALAKKEFEAEIIPEEEAT
ncbi:hypothetical protein C922_05419 [Plasmodium inui San Antonio 1]|uniref:Plasmodium RESA N-terminal domain-containing protein n=1 Tax=Plasmodium inui San Antonio 1 TaxID=1237626 RepID=W6ZY08_9APIC|nr:hypothetical protein C922_05419 [Plasmodium inui San Antonio 1]EUD64208.1 hypothetical protein C922_05419 [Plasmodium inui San Antonio 1]